MNAVAKVSGLRLVLCGVPKRTITTMNQSNDCVAYKTCTELLDKYAGKTNELASRWTAAEVYHVGDNVDLRTLTRHESAGNSSVDCHFYNNLLVRSRLDSTEKSTTKPPLPPKFTEDHLQKLIPSYEDTQQLINDLKPIVASYLSHCDSDYLEISKRESHQYSEEMKKKTEMVSRCS